MKKILRFLTIGTFGACVDLIAFSAALSVTESPYASRIWASLIAILCTWAGNRIFTFEKSKHSIATEITKYYLASVAGATANFIAFTILIGTGFHTYVAYIGGTLCGLLINYTGYNLFVFKT